MKLSWKTAAVPWLECCHNTIWITYECIICAYKFSCQPYCLFHILFSVRPTKLLASTIICRCSLTWQSDVLIDFFCCCFGICCILKQSMHRFNSKLYSLFLELSKATYYTKTWTRAVHSKAFKTWNQDVDASLWNDFCVKDLAFWWVSPQALLYLGRVSPGTSATSAVADTTWGAVKWCFPSL